jgi:Ig-fold domain
MMRPEWALLLPAWLALYCIQCQICFAAQTQVITLENSARWTLSNVHGYNNISIDEVTVPSYVLETLQQQGYINPDDRDLAYRYNERDLAWVANDTWTYTATWNLDSNLLFEPNTLSQGENEEQEEEVIDPSYNNSRQRQHYRALLLLNGIDTAATITLNNHSLGFIANSHRRHVFDITDSLLLEGLNNVLEITIKPAAMYAATQAAKHFKISHQTVPYTKQLGNTGQYNFIRKAASDFGWDWGPSFAPAGISAGVEFIIRNSGGDDKQHTTTAASAAPVAAPVYLTDLGLRQHHLTTNESILVTADAFFRPILTSTELESIEKVDKKLFSGGVLEIKISGPIGNDDEEDKKEPKQTWSSETELSFLIDDLLLLPPPTNTSNTNTYSKYSFSENKLKESASWVIQKSVDVLVTPPFELWWPWDLGNPVLYNVTVTFKPAVTKQNLSSVLQLGRKKTEKDDEGESARSYQVMHRQIGFRTVELIQDPITIFNTNNNNNKVSNRVVGETFLFKINKIPIFARGANIVPLDLLPTKVSISKIKHAVFSARHANMNFLRVWGGGRYFPDRFYQECDKNGILVWQEFMYACAMYPADAFYLSEASEEARQQVLRIISHPSVVIWGGNNENEAAFSWFPETKLHPERYHPNYEVLFVRILREKLLSLDPDAIYVDSSPSNGLICKSASSGTNFSISNLSKESKKKWGDVTDPTQGDVHYYNYLSNLLDPNSYPPAKFISEFGYMSLPSFDSYSKQSKIEDWVVGGELMNVRMRHGDGLEQIENQLQMHFTLDSKFKSTEEKLLMGKDTEEKSLFKSSRKSGLTTVSSTIESERLPGDANKLRSASSNSSVVVDNNNSIDRFQAYIYLTQLQQALIYDTAATTWRLNKNDPIAYTAGLLYWQLNDVWAGPSWSGIDYDGRWKVLHYAARRFFSPIGVFGKKSESESGESGDSGSGGFWNRRGKDKKGNGKDEDIVEVWVVNDGREEVQGRLEIYAVPFNATSASDILNLLSISTVTAAAGSKKNSDTAGSILINVAGSGSVVGWRSDFSETQWGSVQGAASQVYLQLRFCTAAAAENKMNNIGVGGGGGEGNGSVGSNNEGCVENVMMLGEFKDASLVKSVQVQATVEERNQLEIGKKQHLLLRGGGKTGSGGGNDGGNLKLKKEDPLFTTNSSYIVNHNKVFEVTLTAQGGVALYVYLETPLPGYFSDNLIMVMPFGEGRKVLFFLDTRSEEEGDVNGDNTNNKKNKSNTITEEEFRESLRVMWLQKALNYFPGQERRSSWMTTTTMLTPLSFVTSLVFEMVVLSLFFVLISIFLA